MSTAGAKPQYVTNTHQFVAKSGVTFNKGVGVVVDAVASDGTVTVDVAAAGENCIGVTTAESDATVGDGTKKIGVHLLAGGGTIRVKASSTATAGSYAKAGTDGFENATIGGGTSALYLAGQFLQSGVDGDYVEMTANGQAAVGS